jgi:nicotinamide-nucleotide amidase
MQRGACSGRVRISIRSSKRESGASREWQRDAAAGLGEKAGAASTIRPTSKPRFAAPHPQRSPEPTILFNSTLVEAAKAVLARAKAGGLGIVTAESCTSGLLASVLSEAPGAAELLHGGFVTYTKENKAVALGVSTTLLKTKGAVCEEVARAMAEGALARSPAEVSVAITGVAGPSSDEDGNPVGLVCIAVARRGFPTSSMQQDYGDIGRDAVRERAIQDALAALTAALDDHASEPSGS